MVHPSVHQLPLPCGGHSRRGCSYRRARRRSATSRALPSAGGAKGARHPLAQLNVRTFGRLPALAKRAVESERETPGRNARRGRLGAADPLGARVQACKRTDGVECRGF